MSSADFLQASKIKLFYDGSKTKLINYDKCCDYVYDKNYDTNLIINNFKLCYYNSKVKIMNYAKNYDKEEFENYDAYFTKYGKKFFANIMKV